MSLSKSNLILWSFMIISLLCCVVPSPKSGTTQQSKEMIDLHEYTSSQMTDRKPYRDFHDAAEQGRGNWRGCRPTFCLKANRATLEPSPFSTLHAYSGALPLKTSSSPFPLEASHRFKSVAFVYVIRVRDRQEGSSGSSKGVRQGGSFHTSPGPFY